MNTTITRFQNEMSVSAQAKKILSENKMKGLYETQLVDSTPRQFKKQLFEGYDELAAVNKTKVDSLYFQKLTNNLDFQFSETATITIDKLFETVDSIYQFVNIKPAIYGKDITHQILNESIDKAENKISNTIAKYIQQNFYSLSKEEKCIKFESKVIAEAKEFVKYDLNIDEATTLGIKKCVMENFITSICFPPLVWSQINGLSTCDKFNKIFEVEELMSLLEDFKINVSNLSAIIATCV